MSDNNNKTNQKETTEDFEERLRKETKPPDGQRIKLHSLMFAEAIKINHFEKLENGLDRLYQERLHFQNAVYGTSDQANYKSFIAKSRKSLQSLSWIYLQGFFSKTFAESNKGGILTLPVRDLPTGVKSIEFLLAQIMPSYIIVIINVKYDSTVSDSLNNLFNNDYPEQSEEKKDGTVFFTSPEQVKSNTIHNFLLELQNVLESFISQYFTGAFLSEKTESPTKCPSIKLFYLQDIPFTPQDALITWLQEHFRFIDMLSYLGLPLLTHQFANEYLLFSESSNRNEETPILLSLLTSESLFISEAQAKNMTPEILIQKYGYGFKHLASLLALNNLLLRHSRRLINYRSKVDNFRVHTKGNLNKHYPSAYNAKVRINEHYYDYIKLRQELEYTISPQFEPMLYREIPKFELLENPNHRPHYAKELISNVRFLASNLDKEYSLLNDRYSDLFETINAQLNSKLNESNNNFQKTISILTIVLVSLTLLMLVAIIIQISMAN